MLFFLSVVRCYTLHSKITLILNSLLIVYQEGEVVLASGKEVDFKINVKVAIFCHFRFTKRKS